VTAESRFEGGGFEPLISRMARMNTTLASPRRIVPKKHDFQV
jgi:hypothetical protein